MELLIGHLKLDVLILFFDIVDERVDWGLCRLLLSLLDDIVHFGHSIDYSSEHE